MTLTNYVQTQLVSVPAARAHVPEHVLVTRRGGPIAQSITDLASDCIRVAAIAATTSILAGCVRYLPAAVSSTAIGNQYEIPVKVVTGTSQASYFLAWGPFGDDSLQAALEDARQKGNGDTLANVFVDRKLICFPHCGFSLYTEVETHVTGTLMKYVDPRAREFQDRPVAVEPIVKIDRPVPVPYSELLSAFNEGPDQAQKVYGILPKESQESVREYVLDDRGNGSELNWKLRNSAAETPLERSFLEWYVKTYTTYQPVFESQ